MRYSRRCVNGSPASASYSVGAGVGLRAPGRSQLCCWRLLDGGRWGAALLRADSFVTAHENSMAATPRPEAGAPPAPGPPRARLQLVEARVEARARAAALRLQRLQRLHAQLGPRGSRPGPWGSPSAAAAARAAGRIGIIGGSGPEAGADLFLKVLVGLYPTDRHFAV